MAFPFLSSVFKLLKVARSSDTDFSHNIDRLKTVNVPNEGLRFEVEHDLWDLGNSKCFMTLLFVTTSWMGASIAYMTLVILFAAQVPYRCSTPEIDQLTLNDEDIRRISVPGQVKQSCFYYDYPYDQMANFDYEQAKTFVKNLEGTPKVITCFEYLMNEEVVPSSFRVFVELDLRCNSTDLASFWIRYSYCFGTMIGTVLGGLMVDWYGRRCIFVRMTLLHICTGFGLAYSPDYWQYCILRTLNAATAFATLISGFCLFIEFTNFRTMTILGMMFPVTQAVGMATFAAVSSYAPNWRNRDLIVLALDIVPLLGIFWIPESIRWHMINRQNRRVLTTVNTLFGSKEVLPQDVVNKPWNRTFQKLTLIWTCTVYRWIFFGLVFAYAFSNDYLFNMVQIEFAELFNLFYQDILTIQPFIHVITYTFLMPMFMRNGKWNMCVISLFTVTLMFAVCFFLDEFKWPAFLISTLARIMVGTSNSSLLVLSVEIFPTRCRGSIIGWMYYISSILFAFLNLVLEPLFYLSWTGFGYITGVILAVVTFFFVRFFVPRTRNRIILNSTGEAILFFETYPPYMP